MTWPFTLPTWLPWWVPIAVLVPGTLYALLFLLMPFSVFGLKGRIDTLEARLDEIQGEIRALILRLPERGGAERGGLERGGLGMGDPRPDAVLRPARPPIPPRPPVSDVKPERIIVPDRAPPPDRVPPMDQVRARTAGRDDRPGRTEPRLG